MKMNKISIIASVMMLSTSVANAGGLLTNTNQHAAFLRNPSRDAIIDIDGVYSNPAGVAFMNNGFHFSFTGQNVAQSRNITTTFAGYPAMGINGLADNVNFLGQNTRKYEGKAKAPIVPSAQAAYVWDKWTIQGSIAITGGGGKCEFADGIGSFEAPYSLIPFGLTNTIAQNPALPMLQAAGVPTVAKGYSMDMYMRGRQYYIGFQVGGSYKILDNLAIGGGLRFVLANCNYTGHVDNINVYYDPANKKDFTGTPLESSVGAGLQSYEIDLNTDQNGLGVTPYLSVDWKINEHWNLAAKYEFKTRMRLNNSTSIAKIPDAAKAVLGAYDENTCPTVKEDIPAFFTIGAQYSPIKDVRINAGFHWYDDTHATKTGNKQDLINSGTTEITAGVEYDVIPLLTVSAGFQRTMYDLSDEYMNDMSFNNTSNLLGCGVRVNVNKTVSVDLGYMVNFYEDRTVESKVGVPGSTLTLPKTDVYSRTNHVFAASINLNF